jgi:hypothetical protein
MIVQTEKPDNRSVKDNAALMVTLLNLKQAEKCRYFHDR